MSTIEIPHPLERQNDESHYMDYPIGAYQGQDVYLAVSQTEIRGAVLMLNRVVIEDWTPDAPTQADQRTMLGLKQTSPLVGDTVRIYHKPNHMPTIWIGIKK